MKLTFLGATQIVTGSRYLLETQDMKVLIDCGMFQGGRAERDLNQRPFYFNPADIDYILLTHAHIDHSGLLPKLCASGYRGPIHATKATTELCGIMLPDSAHIQEFDAEINNRKGKRSGKEPMQPLYTITDAYAALKHFVPHHYDEEVQLSQNITIKFRDAGHILGSSILEIWVTEAGKTTKFVFSGDLGQPNQPIIKDPTFIDSADYVVIESTYGNRRHEDYDKETRLADVINDAVKRGGNIVIPAFAVGRTQTLMYYLHKLVHDGRIPDIPVYIDSPLAISATDIFIHNPQEFDTETVQMIQGENDNPFKLPHLVFARSVEESRAINQLTEPAIIISASGMADAGRILHHLKHNLWRTEATVLFVGYQAEGSLGRRLVEGAKRVKIMGEDISVKAKIISLEGFSAHADQIMLMKWLGAFSTKPANIFIVHGEQDMSEPFSELIKAELKISAYIPKFGEAAVIDGHDWKVEPSSIVLIEPAQERLQQYLAELEATYNDYKRMVVESAGRDNKKLPDLLARAERINRMIREAVKELHGNELD